MTGSKASPFLNMIMNGGMRMGSMNSGSNSTDDGSVSMYFTSWDSYKLQLLFSTWNIETPWQFALSWFVVAIAAAFYHYLDCTVYNLDQGKLHLRLNNIYTCAPIYKLNNAIFHTLYSYAKLPFKDW